ncbi:MAG: ankyrin repeat domain-containing protein [Ilumatobacteraceae bacterium]
MSTPPALVVEVLADGGIRMTSLAGATGLASLPATRHWIAEAHRAGAAVHLRGEVSAPSAILVADEVRRLASSLDEAPSQPAPWPNGRSSIQTAASNGLTEQVTDLLDRGVSPNDGRRWETPYRLAMQHGHADVLVALRDAGAAVPRGLAPPAVLPHAVVLRAYSPRWIWWLLVPFLALAAGALIDRAYAVAPAFAIIPLIGSGAVHLVLGNTRCAFDGPYVARRRGRHWQGPIDVRTLDALGYTPPGTVRMPVLWVLGQRGAGDRPNVYARSAFDDEQRAAIAKIEGLRFVPLYAARGFLSPGIERLLARHLDRATVIVGPIAEERLGPGWKDRRS